MRAEQIRSHANKALRYRWALPLRARRFIAVVALIAFGGAVFACHVNPEAHLEHGALENFQAAVLLLAAIALFGGATRTSGPPRIFALGLSLFCFVFLMLEFDTRAFNSAALRRLTNGAPRNIWLGTLVALYAIAFWRHHVAMPSLFQRWLSGRAGLLMLISGAFWIAGGVFEHGKFFADADTTLMLEEVLEVNAALFMAWSAFATVRLFSARGAAASKLATPP